MKLLSAIAIVAALSSPAKAGPLEDFVYLTVMLPPVSYSCPAYKLIEGAPAKYAMARGIDYVIIGRATTNAILAATNGKYDKTQLIPGVTEYVRTSVETLGHEMETLGMPGFCKKYGPVLVGAGLMK